MLNEVAIQKVVRGVRKSVSVRSVILSGNPGLHSHVHSEEPRAELIQRAAKYLQAEVKRSDVEVPKYACSDAESVISDVLFQKAKDV